MHSENIFLSEFSFGETILAVMDSRVTADPLRCGSEANSREFLAIENQNWKYWKCKKKLKIENINQQLKNKIEPLYFITKYFKIPPLQPAITCSKLTIETLEQGVKYVQS